MRLRLLPLALAAIVFATSVPLEWRAASWSLDFGVTDFLLNILLFAPLGAALWRRPLGAVVVAAAALSTTVELLQLWQVGRFTSPFDVLANTIGAAVGLVLARRAAARGIWLRPDLIGLDRRVGAVALLGVAVLLTVWAVPPRLSNLSAWDAGSQMIAGNDASGLRPWSGRLDGVVLWPRASSHHHGFAWTAARLAADEHAAWHLPSPLVLRGGPALRLARDDSRRFAEQAMRRNAFTVVATITADDVERDEPALLLGFSAGALPRNFELEQQGRKLVFRVRTSSTDLDRAKPWARTPSMLRAGAPVRVVASYDGKIARIDVEDQTMGRINLAAAGCLWPALCDVNLALGAAAFGMGLASLALMLARPRSTARARTIALLAGLLGAACLQALHVTQRAGLFPGLAALLALAGASCVAMAVVAQRKDNAE